MPRLVLSRKVGERINIGDNIVIEITDIDRGKVRIAVMAPPEVLIYRSEIDPRRRPDEPPPSYGQSPRG